MSVSSSEPPLKLPEGEPSGFGSGVFSPGMTGHHSHVLECYNASGSDGVWRNEASDLADEDGDKRSQRASRELLDPQDHSYLT